MNEKKVVLVVDDEPFIVDMVTTFLGLKGYEVRGANTGEEGLTLIPLEKPDMLLLDLMLPDMEGFEVCRRVRAMPDFARIPVLIISARVEPESKARAEKAGASGYMIKPIKMPELLAEVEKLLSAPPAETPVPPAAPAQTGVKLAVDNTFWQSIVDAQYAVPEGHTVASLTPELVSYLGGVDALRRDIFAYSILSQWVLRGHYPPADLRAMLAQFSGNLTRGIGETGTDSVFLRSFSVLMLAVIMYYDNHHQPFVTEAEVRGLMEKVLVYFAAEKDLRGFIMGKGWAHSCAHTSDLIDELAISRYLSAADLERLANAIADKLMTPGEYLYIHEEDDRLAYTTTSILKRDLVPGAFWETWLGRFATYAQRKPRPEILNSPVDYGPYLNVKNFLRSLYIRLAQTDDLPESARALLPGIQAAIRAHMSF